MRLFEIKRKVEAKYKDGNDWIYDKGKKAEIDLIKALIEICDSQVDEIIDLQKEVQIVDHWRAYRKAINELQDAQNLEMAMRMGLIEYDTVVNKLDEARDQLRECTAYMDTIHKKLKEKSQ
jgi:hypothetical protein